MKKIKDFKLKNMVIPSFLLSIYANMNKVYADIVSEVNGGGEIQNSKLGQGVLNIVRDLTGTMQWILPIVGVCIIMFYVIKIMTGDEQDLQRYKKSIIKVLICIIIGILAVSIVNLISRYF